MFRSFSINSLMIVGVLLYLKTPLRVLSSCVGLSILNYTGYLYKASIREDKLRIHSELIFSYLAQANLLKMEEYPNKPKTCIRDKLRTFRGLTS